MNTLSMFVCGSILFVLAGIGCCSNSSVEKDGNMNDTSVIGVSDASVVDQIVEDSVTITDDLTQFKCVLDTLNSSGDRLVHSEYFLYDITGDGISELWIKSGSCEADYMLRAYTMKSGNPRKIYEGDGGHSDFFIYKGQLVCVMCNTGAGVVITYSYNGKRVVESMVNFSTWNDKGDALSEPHDSKADEKLKYWEYSYGDYIELNPLR